MVAFTVGSEFQVNQTTQGFQGSSAIATDAQGNFVVAWGSEFFDGDQSAIVARQFRADGTPRGDEIAINSFITGNQYSPDVAMDLAGNFVVTWENDQPTSDGGDISARRFKANGKPMDKEDVLAIHSNTSGQQVFPKSAMNAKGEYVIVWQAFEGAEAKIYAQRFNENGAKLGDELLVGEDGLEPDVSIDADGNFVVTWYGSTSDPEIILARRFDARSESLSEIAKVGALGKGDQQAFSSIAMDKRGNFAISWTRANFKSGDSGAFTTDIYAQTFNAQGVALREEFLVNSVRGDLLNYYSDVAIDNHGNLVVAWDRGTGNEYDVYARRFKLDGRPISEEFRVNSFTEGYQVRPVIGIQPEGDFIVGWESYGQDGNGSGVFAQRFELVSQIALPHLNLKAKEGKSAKLILNRLDETHMKVDVNLDIIGGNAKLDKDYQFSDPLTVTFEPGETKKAIKIPIIKDKLIEKKETFTVQVQAGDRTYVQERNSIKISILDASRKEKRTNRVDALLGDEKITVGKDAVSMPKWSDRPFQPLEESQPTFAQTFDINPFTGTGSISMGYEAPDTSSLFAPALMTETPFTSAVSSI